MHRNQNNPDVLDFVNAAWITFREFISFCMSIEENSTISPASKLLASISGVDISTCES